MPKINKQCKICKNIFYTYNFKQLYCSIKCAGISKHKYNIDIRWKRNCPSCNYLGEIKWNE